VSGVGATSRDLGVVIRRARRERHLSIETLAFAADMHPTYLSGIERGIRNPTWVKLRSLADALQVPVSAIVQGAEDEAQVQQATREARARVDAERRAVA